MSKPLLVALSAALLLTACNRRPAPPAPKAAPQAEEKRSIAEFTVEDNGGRSELADARSDAYRLCMADPAAIAQTSVVLENCAVDELARQDKVVEGSLKALIAKAPAADQALARDAQRAWVVYRDAECASRGAVNEGGTIQALVIAICRTDLALLRDDDLLEQAENY